MNNCNYVSRGFVPTINKDISVLCYVQIHGVFINTYFLNLKSKYQLTEIICCALYLCKVQRGSCASDLSGTLWVPSAPEQLQPPCLLTSSRTNMGHQSCSPPSSPQVRPRFLGASVRDGVADLPHVHLRELLQLPPLLLPQLLLHPRGRGQLRLRGPGQRQGPGLQQGRQAPAHHLLPGQLPVQVRGKEESCGERKWGSSSPYSYGLACY